MKEEESLHNYIHFAFDSPSGNVLKVGIKLDLLIGDAKKYSKPTIVKTSRTLRSTGEARKASSRLRLGGPFTCLRFAPDLGLRLGLGTGLRSP